MLVSIEKNIWLWNWIYDLIDDKDPEFREYLTTAFARTKPEEIKRKLLLRLENFGYKVKFTSNKDCIIIMTEQEFIFLKLKYN